ncbi:protein-L-isoaspartate(D-aspartate) O-methyltransferase [candidate division KSB1 bacterium]|nr:protein-L-isoaspartate(D-aspartate) O-methyltransferase [candidate division KSB1 bacterium]
MIDFQEARIRMVREQLVARGIRDQSVLMAMQKVERHRFVSCENQSRAYDDMPLPIPSYQTISQPYIVALMTELLKLKPDDCVLEIGTGSGYQTAILAELSRLVYSIERNPVLAALAQDLLIDQLEYSNIQIQVGDGTIGWIEKSPFQAIIITAGAPAIPENLVDSLANYGNMVVPVGSHDYQELMVVSKRGDSYISKKICNCVFVPLIGKEGWPEE